MMLDDRVERRSARVGAGRCREEPSGACGHRFEPMRRCPIGRGPVAVGKAVIIGGVLDHAVQREVFDDLELSHSLSLGSVGIKKRSWIHACHSGVSRAAVPAA